MIKVCKQCGIEYKTWKSEQMYCSHECRVNALKKPRKQCICKYCGKEYITDRYTSLGLYCSLKCESDYKHQEKLERIKIKKILKEKEKAEKARIKAEQKRIEEERKEAERIKTCVECGKVFHAITANNIYCSKVCRNRVENRKKDKRLNKCKIKDYSINLIDVYKKDNGICQGCHQLLTFGDDRNDDMYPSIDHIIPVAKGGNHSWDNVQLMCRRCNYLKKDKIG